MRHSLLKAVVVVALVVIVPVTTMAAGSSDTSKEKSKIVYWSMFSQGENLQEILDPAISEFMTENPGVEVERVWQGRGVLTKVQAALAANTQIDIVDQSTDLIITGLVKANLVIPLDKYLDEKAYDSNVPWKDTFISSVLEVDRMPDGHVYTVPRDDYIGTFWYSKGMLDGLGLKPQAVDMPWSDFVSMLDKIKAGKPGVSPLGIRGAQLNFTNLWSSYAMIREAGPEAFRDAALDKTGQAWLKDSAFRSGLEKDWYFIQNNYFQKGYEGFVRPQEETVWVNGQVAMLLAHGWLPSEAKASMPAGFTARMFAYPKVEGGKGNKYEDHYSNGYAVMKSTKYADASAALLKFILSKKIGSRLSATVTVPLKVVAQPETHTPQPDILNAHTPGISRGGLTRTQPEWINNVYGKVDGAFWARKVGPQEFVGMLAQESKAYWANR